MDIELHIFTNSTINAPDTWHIESTYKSFMDTFNANIPVTVWCDKNPNKEKCWEYIEALGKIFPVVNHEVGGLSHGYHMAVRGSDKEFLFMLEHDWLFNKEHIPHTLDQIVDGMRKDNILHMRFNRKVHGNHPDVHASFGHDMDWVDYEGSVFPYAMVNAVSNNPHIINRQRWLAEAAKHTHYVGFGQEYGLEEYLTGSPIRGAIYGPRGHPPTIVHTDGKNPEHLRNVNLLN